MFVVPSDFKGIYQISQNKFTEAKLNDIIDQVEKSYLVKLFGAELYPLFIADLDVNNEPQTARFIRVFEPFVVSTDNGIGFFYREGEQFSRGRYYDRGGLIPEKPKFYESEGIKTMLIGFIYRYAINNGIVTNTPAGSGGQNMEAASKLSGIGVSNLTQVQYNKAIDTFKAIRYLMLDSSEAGNYPEYNGVDLDYSFMGL